MRALAAVTVMVSHALGDIVYHGGPNLFRLYYAGAAGVDLFFVISGFVMVYSGLKLFGISGGAAEFLRKRLCRIVPLYWAATAAYVLVQIGQGKWDVVRPTIVLTSLVFWPYSDATGLRLPIYGIGWTLNDEMFFYTVFSVGLFLPPRAGLTLVFGILAALVVTGALMDLPYPLRFWAHPVLIDFLLGMAAALARLRGVCLPRWAASAFASVGAALFIAATLAGFNSIPNVPERFPRWIAWGVPAAMVLCSAVLRDVENGRPRPLLGYLGDASYAIYLLHPLVIIAARPLLPPLLARFGAPLAVSLHLGTVSVVVLSAAALVHSGLERPLMRWMTGPRCRVYTRQGIG